MATQFVQRPQTFPSLWKRHGGKASAPSESQRRWRRGICQTNFRMEKQNRTVWRNHIHWIGLKENLNRKPWCLHVFTIKLIGLSGFNVPIIQFYDTLLCCGMRSINRMSLKKSARIIIQQGEIKWGFGMGKSKIQPTSVWYDWHHVDFLSNPEKHRKVAGLRHPT